MHHTRSDRWKRKAEPEERSRRGAPLRERRTDAICRPADPHPTNHLREMR